MPRLRIPPTFLFIVRHFGTGVLLATAFVHLLPTAFVSLNDPCLPAFWNEDYPAMPGAIALASVFIIAVIEMVFSPGRSVCAAPMDIMHAGQGDNGSQRSMEVGPCTISDERTAAGHSDSTPPNTTHSTPTALLYGRTNYGRTNSIGQQLARITAASEQQDHIGSLHNTARESRTTKIVSTADVEETQYRHELSPEQKQEKAMLQCLLLEIGILFHSVFIGMALSVALGNDFIVLLIAITFHQTFEGLALGSRIAAMAWKKRAWQPWVMALAYGCTTPLGQAIGLATHTLYSPDSMTGLLMVGIMNAISSGLLTFTSLIDLLSEDFLSDESWHFLRGKKRITACVLVFAGAFGMSLVGAWA
ncbi:Zinc-regulated transporter 2 [Exophiala dermatitidis]